MMKRSNKICILLGVLVVICFATFGVLRMEERKEQIKNSDEIILELPSESVTSLAWEYESNSLAFHKDETWLYDEDEAFPVDEEKINELLELFQEFGVSFIIEDVEDYSQYGLENPVCTIDLAAGEETYEILLGNYSTMDSERYVSIGDGNVYLVKKDPMDYFDITISDVIDHDEIPSLSEVTRIEFAGTENYSIVYEEDSDDTYCSSDVYFVSDEAGNLPLDTTIVNRYLKTISNLNPTDYVTYNATEEELQSYGLDVPELSVTVDYVYKNDEKEEVSDTFVLNIGRDPEEIKADEEADEEEEDEDITAYIRVGQSQIVYKISADHYKDLMAVSYDSLRHPEVFTADFSDVRQIDVSLEGTDYSFTSEDQDEERTYYYLEEEVDLDDFQSAVKALQADSFTDEKPSQKEEISLTVYLDNENYPEVTIQLYRYDGSFCLAVVNGEPVSLVSRSYVVDLIETINAIVLN